MLIFQIESVDYMFILKSLYGVTAVWLKSSLPINPLVGGGAMGEVVGHHNDFLLEHNPKLDLNPQRLQKELQLTCTPGAKYHPDCMDIFWPQNNRLQMSGKS